MCFYFFFKKTAAATPAFIVGGLNCGVNWAPQIFVQKTENVHVILKTTKNIVTSGFILITFLKSSNKTLLSNLDTLTKYFYK